ncbi:MAG: N-acetylglucosamine-6-phosphate deacetylase [Chloroflexi bacterium]|nr:N-acetylglucosamine-6-phosphate deacetylase [Chloroflexota bacterium]
MILKGRILLPGGEIAEGQVVAGDGLIEQVKRTRAGAKQIIAPGFIDLQVNGAFGHDFTTQPETINAVAHQLLAAGVTAFLPTIITTPLQQYPKVFEALPLLSPSGAVVRGGGARVLGLHLEGPYLSPERPGAHDPVYLRPSVTPLADNLIHPSVRLMTLAPELNNGLQAVHNLSAQEIVVGLGHSAATYEQARAALVAGARWGTHLFNAMTPLHHREPGLIGALLADDEAFVGAIADGVHVHPSIFKWLVKAKGAERITLVSDAMAAAGMMPGEYSLAGSRVIVDERSARLENGTLAGSILTMDQAVRNLVAWGACSLADALTMASTSPARLLRLDHLGRIEAGCSADFVVLDESLNVRQTIIGGQVVFER